MIVPVDIVAVQVNQNNSLFVTTGVDYDSDGAVVGSEITAQYTLNPGAALDGQPTEVVNIANALWTPAVVAAYTTNQQLGAIVKQQQIEIDDLKSKVNK